MNDPCLLVSFTPCKLFHIEAHDSGPLNLHAYLIIVRTPLFVDDKLIKSSPVDIKHVSFYNGISFRWLIGLYRLPQHCKGRIFERQKRCGLPSQNSCPKDAGRQGRSRTSMCGQKVRVSELCLQRTFLLVLFLTMFDCYSVTRFALSHYVIHFYIFFHNFIVFERCIELLRREKFPILAIANSP